MNSVQFLIVRAALQTIRVVIESIPMRDDVRHILLAAKQIIADLIEAINELKKS